MTSFTDDFTSDHFADGTYTLFPGTTALSVAGGVGTCDSICEWLDPRVYTSVIEMSIDVLAGSDFYLLGLGLITLDGATGLDVIAFSGTTWQISFAVGGALAASDAFTVPPGDWTLHLSVAADKIVATAAGQTLELDLPPDSAAALLAAASVLAPLGAVASASLLGHSGATVVVDNFSYSTTGGGTGGGGHPEPRMRVGLNSSGVVARPYRLP